MSKYYSDMKEKKANPGAPGDVYSSEFAGMPKEKVMKEYPKAYYGLDGYGDDIQSIDMFAKQNHMRVKKQQRMMGDS